MNIRVCGVWCLAVLVAGLMTGCGGNAVTEPDLGQVTGTVTVDGKPAADLEVVFEPQLASGGNAKTLGGSSSAVTDASGKYELKYKGGDKKGAVIGSHIVRISSAAGGGPAGGAGAAAITNIPAAYNTESTQKTDVKKGANDGVNFDIKTM